MNKKRYSITTAVFVIAIFTFFLSSAFYILLTGTRLKTIIDNNKTELITHKFDGISGILERKNDRLILSQNIDAYRKAFQDSALFDIHKTYCNNLEKGASILIIKHDGEILSHQEHTGIKIQEIPERLKNKIISKDSGEFTDNIKNEKFWYIFKHYPSWDWFIVYSLPVKEKYSEIKPFYAGFIAAGGAAFLAGMLFLTFFVYKSLLPIVKLTKATEAITEGDLNYRIDTYGYDEISVLAENFEKMRVSIKDKIMELEKTMKELKRSNEDLEQYAYVSSHDLKEPLRILRLYSDLLQKKYSPSLNDEVKEILNFISTAAERMTTQIQDILEYSRAGRFESGIETINIKELINGVIMSYSKMYSNAVIKYESGEVFIIEGDSTGFKQVFSNLIENAIKYNRSEIPEIKITSFIENDNVVFAVADNGIGINKTYFDKIFEIFESLHPKDEFPGTGIGLALCKKVVERHGGRIWVESDGEGGPGSVFKFKLPLKQRRASG
ncbi:MAG: hypothetical protein CVV21_08025 [Candidatus Goldiibacteriota bacterium HGW-Goldbacteria-1]|jgi:signal transduction histidine kinase|nr:MAG: hypothetical protein CVV21_08025 [Candidatus Goldiibacteriota bacterium HGW-Goldbacteria-1]